MNFDKLLTLTLDGLNTGVLYGLVAIGYTMVYGIIKLINFAHGEVMMIGIMISYTLLNAVLWLAGPDIMNHYIASVLLFLGVIFVAAIIDGALGIGIDIVAYKPLRKSSRLSALITAIGVSLFLQNFAVLVWDATQKNLPEPQLFDGNLSLVWILIWCFTVVSMAGLYFLVMKTKLGTAMRACSQNPTAAALMGVRLNLVVAVTFFIGSFFAAFAGVSVALTKGAFDYNIGLYLGLIAFAAAVLGGIGSIPGAMLGGLIIGVTESLAVGYLDSIPHPASFFSPEYESMVINTGYSKGISFLVLVLILLIRPQGILGSKGGDRA